MLLPLRELAGVEPGELFFIGLGNLLGRNSFHCYTKDHVGRDLSALLSPAAGTAQARFRGGSAADFLTANAPATLPVWHLVGGADPLTEDDLSGDEPDGAHPVLLGDWIRQDVLTCLKIKLRD